MIILRTNTHYQQKKKKKKKKMGGVKMIGILTKIFKKVLERGTIPEDWKISNIILLRKKEEPSQNWKLSTNLTESINCKNIFKNNWKLLQKVLISNQPIPRTSRVLEILFHYGSFTLHQPNYWKMQGASDWTTMSPLQSIFLEIYAKNHEKYQKKKNSNFPT